MSFLRTDKILRIDGTVVETFLSSIPNSKADNRQPNANDDITQGFLPFSLWFNTSASPQEVWICYSNVQSAAVWLQLELTSSRFLNYIGSWNASTNMPTLTNGTGNAGDFYITTVAGTADFGAGGVSFNSGDICVYNGSIYENGGSAVPQFAPAQVFTIPALAANNYIDLPIVWAVPRQNVNYSVFMDDENDQNETVHHQVKAGTLTNTGFTARLFNKSVFDITNIKLSVYSQDNLN